MKDNELLVFESGENGLNVFLNVLKRQKEMDIWKKCYTKEIKLHPLYDNPIGLSVLRQEMNIPCSDEVIMEAMETKKGLILEFPLKKIIYVPIRDTAFSSICGRGHISGNALQKMSNDDFCKVMNICMALWKDSCMILYRDDKISAVHSGDSGDYSVLVMYDLVKALISGLEALNIKYVFDAAFLSHSLCSAVFFLDSEEIIRIYSPYLKRMGYERSEKFKPMIRFSSSDVAMCGANIAPYITNGVIQIQIGTPFSVKHQHHSTIDDFSKNVSSIYALFQESEKLLENLENMKLKYPDDCFINVCKSKTVAIATKYLTDAFVTYKSTRSKSPTALELYMALWEIIINMKNEGVSEGIIFQYQEKIARVLTISIEKYDKPMEIK